MIVLDRTVTRVFPTGARLTLTHNIIRVQDKDAIDKFGEVQIPIGRRRARAARGQGRRHDARARGDWPRRRPSRCPTSSRATTSSSSTSIRAAPPGAFPGGFLAERFYFRSYDAPLYRSEYVLAAPREMTLQVDRRGDGVPARERRATPTALRITTFATRCSRSCSRSRRRRRSPSSCRRCGWARGCRRSAGATTSSTSRCWPRAPTPSSRASPPRLTAGATSDADKVRAIDAWVRQHIKGGGGALDEGATSILARERGQPHHARGARCCRGAGVPSQHVAGAAAARRAARRASCPISRASTSRSCVAGGLYLDPRYRHAATGFVSPLSARRARVRARRRARCSAGASRRPTPTIG